MSNGKMYFHFKNASSNTYGVAISVLGIRGLPPRYGAFDQAFLEIATNAKDNKFIIPCSASTYKINFDLPNVVRVKWLQISGLGVIVFNLFFALFTRLFYRTNILLAFGYGLSPFFPILKLIGYQKIVCNVDGFEYQRSKWSFPARLYFRFCERCAAKFSSSIIVDSETISHYYSLKYKVTPSVIYYGALNSSDTSESHPVLDDRFEHLNDTSYALVVQRLEPENNLTLIVSAFLNSDFSKNHRLVVIGPTTKYFEKNLISTFRKHNNLLWLGPIYDRKLLYSIWANAKLYIHGHSVGGVNPTLVEASNLNIPALSLLTPFNYEVLRETGYYFQSEFSCRKLLNSFASCEVPLKKSATSNEIDTNWESIAKAYMKLLDA